MRGRMPATLVRLFPKGRSDCGAHEWYLSEGDVWRCYHCEAGATTDPHGASHTERGHAPEAKPARS
jgi:hypothetical protein